MTYSKVEAATEVLEATMEDNMDSIRNTAVQEFRERLKAMS